MAGNFNQLSHDGQRHQRARSDDLTRGEIDGRRPFHQAFEFPRTVPGLKNLHRRPSRRSSAISETRRMWGGYMLSGEDVLACAS